MYMPENFDLVGGTEAELNRRIAEQQASSPGIGDQKPIKLWLSANQSRVPYPTGLTAEDITRAQESFKHVISQLKFSNIQLKLALPWIECPLDLGYAFTKMSGNVDRLGLDCPTAAGDPDGRRSQFYKDLTAAMPQLSIDTHLVLVDFVQCVEGVKFIANFPTKNFFHVQSELGEIDDPRSYDRLIAQINWYREDDEKNSAICGQAIEKILQMRLYFIPPEGSTTKSALKHGS